MADLASPDVLGGTPVFDGTRVPVRALLDYFEARESIDDFLDGFPSVKREQVVSFLELAKPACSKPLCEAAAP
ncbi:MAG: DUF433 domain-containing protein [Betaproteobacteria bacterium]|nr:DUF433 domain-containing protein [Betaproteobacteria bacterium]